VLHAPFGSRINKAWCLALRKRFCRQFNFELQAAATEDALLLSLGPQHSFPLADVFRYLHPESTRDVLVQAFLDAPVFKTRWRWNATISLAVPRTRAGRRLAPQLQRILADDLMAAVFPDAAACLENIPGDRELPDHPLVTQTVRDCLQEAMDFEGLRAVLQRIHRGELTLVARDTPEPSVFACDILNARPFAFMDDAPLEERRAHAVQTRRSGDQRSDGAGVLDEAAIARVREEARPEPRDADELHDALTTSGLLMAGELAACDSAWIHELVETGRAAWVRLPAVAPDREAAGADCIVAMVAAERLPELLAIHPSLLPDPPLAVPRSRAARDWTPLSAITELVRGRLTMTGPISAGALSCALGVAERAVDAGLLALESEGVVLRGAFSARGAADAMRTAPEWCDRALLARIHRYTLNRLRAEIEPVTPADFMRFLFKWQHVDEATRLTGIDGLREVIAILDGFELAAGVWERAVLPLRMDRYDPAMLDMLCLCGDIGWARLTFPGLMKMAPMTPVALFLREHAESWHGLRAADDRTEVVVTGDARIVLDSLKTRGASFFRELATAVPFDSDRLRHALGVLVAAGLAVSDGFSGVRMLIAAAQGRPAREDRRANFAGRWTALSHEFDPATREAGVERQATTLLRRYGIVFRRLLGREPNAAPWRELTRVYRRLEARGEIRGGRFVSGMAGEQFALPDAVPLLREVRRTPADGRLCTICTADPLNLTGIVTAGQRVRAAGGNRMAYRDGIAVAVMEGDDLRALTALGDAETAAVARALSRRRATRVA
jgi:ATP-dependent Lhr-like helicase